MLDLFDNEKDSLDTTENSESNKKEKSTVLMDTLKTLSLLVVGGVIGSGLFIGAYLIVGMFDIYYVYNSFISLILIFFIGVAWDGISGGKKNPLESPIRSFVIIFFILSFFYGYNKDIEKYNIETKQSVSIKLEMNKNGQVCRTEKVFDVNDQIFISVEGGPIKILGGALLEPGDYLVPVLGTGNLAFENVSNAKVKISVTEKN